MRKKIMFTMALLVSFSSVPVQAFMDEGAKVKATVTREFKSDIDGDAGEITITQTKLSADYAKKVFGEAPFDVGFFYKHTNFSDKSLSVSLPDDLHAFGVDLGIKTYAPYLSEDYFLGFDVSPTVYGDKDNFGMDALRFPMKSYLIYKPSDDLIVVGGFFIRPNFDGNTVLPFVGFKYIYDEQITFNFLSNEPNIEYRLSDKISLLGEFSFQDDEYETRFNGQDGTILKYKESKGGLGLVYDLGDEIKAKVSVGGVFARNIEYQDELGNADPENGLYVAFRFQGKF